MQFTLRNKLKERYLSFILEKEISLVRSTHLSKRRKSHAEVIEPNLVLVQRNLRYNSLREFSENHREMSSLKYM